MDWKLFKKEIFVYHIAAGVPANCGVGCKESFESFYEASWELQLLSIPFVFRKANIICVSPGKNKGCCD